MEGELIIVTIISTLGGLMGLIIVNHNWFRRQEIKFDYELKRARINRKAKQTVLKTEPERSIKDDIIGSFVKNLEPDQIAALADKFLPERDIGGEDSELGGLDGLVDFAAKNPEIVKSFLGGVKGGKSTQDNSSQV